MNLLKFIYYKIQRIYLYIFYEYKITHKFNFVSIGNKDASFSVNNLLLNQDSILYSFGIGKDISFDLALYNLTNCYIFAFDPTPKSIEWVNMQFNLPSKFNFESFGIGLENLKTKFYLPKSENFISGSIYNINYVDSKNYILVDLYTLETITDKFNHNSIDVLKLDIEGLEFNILQNLPSCITIKQILVEFHNRNFKNGNQIAKKTINSLYKQGFRLYSISNSNTELSFININHI
jgi:FkbM family methyltransferase